MIGSVRGVVADRPAPGELIVEVQGVGYRLSVPTGLASTAGPGTEVFLHVHTHVRDDAIVLFGFAHGDERRCFEALLGAHGVGPALALAILSALSPAALSAAVLEEDVDILCQVPGVGKKTAARLLLELQSRLDLPDLDGAGTGPVVRGGEGAMGEARAALGELGYSAEEVRRALDGVDADGTDGPEALVRAALRQLSRAR